MDKTPELDETPPEVVESSVIEKTDTTVKLHLETNEPLRKLTVRYRLVGSIEWLEEEIIPVALAFDIELAELTTGAFYEYQYVLEDETGNQTITEWEKI